MREIALVVEGPSDDDFWRRLLARLYGASEHRVEIVVTRDRGRLIARSSDLVASHRDDGYRATFFLLDIDRDACVRRVLDRFPEDVRRSAKEDDDVFICVAVRGLESWYLADANAVNTVFEDAEYSVPADVEGANPKSELRRLRPKYDKRWLARRFGNEFDPAAGGRHSPSLGRAWRLMSPKLQALEDEILGEQT
ncbi:hypothetical protein CMK11_07795 [Candidatus Poribacteria bacterium]|nr:hypothetical protein [Candidatus Poribacteria bacterium]